MDESHHARILHAVEQRTRSFEAAERAVDAEALIGHFAIGSDAYVYNDGQRIPCDVMATSVRSSFPMLRSIEGGFVDLQVMVLGPDAALATARFHEIVTDATGNQIVQHGAASWLWRQKDNEWRITYGHVDHYPGVLRE